MLRLVRKTTHVIHTWVSNQLYFSEVFAQKKRLLPTHEVIILGWHDQNIYAIFRCNIKFFNNIQSMVIY